MTDVPRPEYPRPRWRRERWRNLNGPWRFAFDDADVGAAQGWAAIDADRLDAGAPYDREIVVPFAHQTPASGIDDRSHHPVVWYARLLDVGGLAREGERLLLHVGAADHDATVWVNGTQVAHHLGGYTPFSADVTDALRPDGRDVVVIRVEDGDDVDQLRGKQYWRSPSTYIFYTATTGIWQTVWLEPVPVSRVLDAHVVPVLEAAAVDISLTVSTPAVGDRLRVTITRDGGTLVRDELALVDARVRRRWRLNESLVARDAKILEYQGVATWHPGDPALYDLQLEVLGPDGEVTDEVQSYFGMRSVGVRDGRVLLNGRPLYQRLVLDQGFHAEGGYTALSDDAIRGDIELAQRLGFNGARRHQKIADPRYLYWADRLGFLVWEEMPSAFRFSEQTVASLTQQWQEAVVRDRNHPCVLVWVPVNESWGVPAVGDDPDGRQAHLLRSLYHLTKALDPTRLVVSNDGWEHALTDLCTIHDYGNAAALRERFADRATAVGASPLDHAVYVRDASHRGEPIIVSEFGGIALDASGTWGFHIVADGEALLERYRAFVRAVVDSTVVAGFCWTQLTDIEQEANGLADVCRRPKADEAALREATLQRGAGTGPARRSEGVPGGGR